MKLYMMKMLIRGVIILVCVMLVLSCSRGISYRITGTWENGAGKKLFLNELVEGKELRVVDSAVVKPDFTFSMKGNVDKVQKMALSYGKDKKKEIIVTEEPLEVTLMEVTKEWKGKPTTSVHIICKGGEEQEWLEKGASLKTMVSFMQLGKMMAASKVDYDDPVAVDSVKRMIQVLDSSLTRAVQNYMDSTRNNYASTYFFESYLMDNYSFEEVKSFYNRLTDRVKQSAPGIELKKKIDEMGTVSVGGIAPNFKAMTPDGKELSLYDLRGHIVLLDFWASWCGPCMAEMPNVKEIYKKYHDKGLEILGVSLDSKKEPWVNAIEKNELMWHHVSTLNKFDCPIAGQFRVTGIPRMYILDKDGKIIAQDLRGEELAKKMDELFNQ